MKLSTIEQFDLIATVRGWLTRRRRARRIERIRDNADAIFFARLADQHRADQAEREARRRFMLVFGETFADLEPWQRQLVYDVMAARESGQEIVAGLPLRSF